MTDQMIQVITTVAAAVSGVAAYFKAREAAKQIHEVKLSINGRLDELLKVTRSEAHAQGVNAGMISGKPESAEVRVAGAQVAALQAEALMFAEAINVLQQKAAANRTMIEQAEERNRIQHSTRPAAKRDKEI